MNKNDNNNNNSTLESTTLDLALSLSLRKQYIEADVLMSDKTCKSSVDVVNEWMTFYCVSYVVYFVLGSFHVQQAGCVLHSPVSTYRSTENPVA